MVGTANPDGSNVNKRLIEFPQKNGQSDVCPTGIVASSSHLYWFDTCRGYGIGQASVDGSGVNPTLLPPAATGDGPCDLAVDSTHLYWMLCSPEQYPNGNGYIGRSGSTDRPRTRVSSTRVTSRTDSARWPSTI